MRPTHTRDHAHHSHDGNNSTAPKNVRKRSGGFMKRTRTLLAAFVVVGVLAAGFMVMSGRAAALSFHLPASVTKIFASRTSRAAPSSRTISAPAVDPLAPTAVMLSWNTFGNLGTETTEPSTANDPNLSAANLTLGSVTAAANGNRFGGSNWFDTGDTNPTTLAESIAGNDYIQFIVTPNAGFSFTPTSLVFNWDRSGTGPSNVTLRSSADSFSTDLGSVSGIATGGVFATNTITISGLTNLTTATTFRLYGYGAMTAAGTGGFDIGTNVNNVILNGTTAATTPTITTTGGPLTFTNTNVGSTSAEQTYTVSGSNLTADITVTAPSTDFQVSKTTATGFAPSVTFTQSGGTVATQTVFVRFTPQSTGLKTGDVANASSGATTQNVAASGTGTPPDATFTASGNLAAGTYNNVTINNCGTFVTMTGNVIINGTLTINACAHLLTETFIVSGPGSLVLAADGWLHIGDANGITTSPTLSGSIQLTGTRSYSTAANYQYTGVVNQAVGNGLPGTVADLLIANAGPGGNNTVTGNSGQIVTGLLEVVTGVYSSASDYVDVQIDVAGTLSLVAPITVSGNWTNNGTFTSNGFGVTFDGTANQTISGSSATSFAGLTVSNTGGGGSNIVTLSQNSSDTALNITSGVFSQGGSADLTSGPATISSGATWSNLATGDLTLSGDVANAGTITFNANGASCGDADDILIRSSVGGTQRVWSGIGTFNMTDVDVQDQRTPVVPPPAIILVTSGTDSGNNIGWSFTGACTAGTYTWSGTVNTDWQVPANWTPTRAVPAPGDILYIDGTATPGPIITNVPTQTIAALRLINGTFATLNASAVAPPQTLTVNGATGTDLTVPVGSFLTLDGSNGLTIKVSGVGTIGTIGGGVVMQGGFHRLFGDSNGVITFQSGAFGTAGPGLTSNPFGTGVAGDGDVGSVIFASGAIYSHNAGDSPFGTVGNGPVATFQTGSIARWFTSSGFQASGRTYADLQIGGGSPAVSVTDSGSGNFQFDNLTVVSPTGTNSSLTFNGSGTSAITIRGNITSNGVGVGTLSDVTLTPGSGSITIDKVGTVTFGNDGSNARAIDFEGNATVTNGTTLALSRVLLLGLSNPHLRTLAVDATGNITGGSSGYVVGSLKKTSVPSGSFVFPVGTAGAYSPLDLANTSGGGDLTVAARAPQQPVLIAGTSLHRYWTLTEGGAGITADLTFHYLDGDVFGTEANYQVVVVDGTPTYYPETCPSTCVNETSNTIRKDGVTTFSDWTAAEPAAPTAVRLMDFSATRDKNDEVAIQWRSGYEARNLGYIVYREQDGKRVPITPSLVAGSALIAGRNTVMTAGLSYTWYDQLGQKSEVRSQKSEAGTQNSELRTQNSPVTYWLEDFDLNGTRTLHGPIAPAIIYGKTKRSELRADLINEVSGRSAATGVIFNGWPVGFNEPQSQPVDSDAPLTQREIAGLPGVKLTVTRAGWYRVAQPEILAAGLNATDYPLQLQLYANGAEVPIKVSGNDKTFTATDYIEFYGRELESATDIGQTYYLILGKTDGKRVKLQNANPGTPVAPVSFDYTVERKERMIYFSGLLNGDGENFFGQIVSSSAASATIPASQLDPAGTAAELEVVLQGVTNQSHLVQVRLNGADLGTLNFANTDHPSQRFTVPVSALNAGNNTVELTSLGGPSDVSLVDALRLTYPHLYAADNNALAINVDNNRTNRISGFSNGQVRVVDITNSNNQVELAPFVAADGQGGFTADVRVPSASMRNPRNVVVFAASAIGHPDSIKSNEPSSWWSQTAGADYLMITTRDLLASVEPLAQLRRNQGMIVQVVDVEDLYDEFSFGEHSPRAVRDFLETAMNTWTRKPHYVLLAGDASYDPKNYGGQGFNDLVPTRLVDTALMETASDDWLADFNGDDVADLAMGRLPVRTVAETNALVAKILSYEGMAPDPSRGALLVADRNFESMSNALQPLFPSSMPKQVINRSSADDTTIHNQIIAGLNQGPSLVNYLGHGSNGVWTGAPLLSNPDAPGLTNSNRLSVFVMMTCRNGYFHDASYDSLAEALLRAPGGAVAVWTSSGMTDPAGQNLIDQEFYRQLFSASPATLGDAVRAAKYTTGDADVRRTWVLFGDPAMRLR